MGEDGYFPYQDIFSYTPTKPLWVYHEWLTGVIFYFIYKSSGPAGLQLFRYLIIILTIYLIYLTALKRGGRPISASLALIPAMLLLSFGYVPIRAQVFTYLFFILTLFILIRANKTKKWSILWWLVLIQILWANLHGGFISGLGLIFLYALGEKLSKKEAFPYLRVGLVSALTTLINPYGLKYWTYLMNAILMPRPEIDEWKSVIAALQDKIYDVPVLIFVILSLILSFFVIWQRERNLTDLLLIAVTMFLGYKSIRHNIFFALIFGSYLPAMLSKLGNVGRIKNFGGAHNPWITQAAPFVLLFLIYFLINPSLSIRAFPSFKIISPAPYFPVGAVKWLHENNLQGNILPHFDWGEFLIWTCAPFCRVAMDGRYETIYKEEVCREYFDFLAGRDNWKTFLQKYPHDMVLIKANTKTHSLMIQEPSWKLVYADQGSVLFVRKK